MRAWDLVLEVSEQLAEAGVTTPAADARWLVCHALKCDSAALVLRDASPGDRDKVAGFVARRRTGEPVQYITGVGAVPLRNPRCRAGGFHTASRDGSVGGRGSRARDRTARRETLCG